MKLLLTLLTLATLVFAQEPQEPQEESLKQIQATKAKILELQASLKAMEDALPSNIKAKADLAIAKEQREKAFVFHGELGYSNTGGNTNKTDKSLELSVKKKFDKHIFELSLDGKYSDDDGEETENKYLIELEYDYELTDRFDLDYIAGYKNDKFSGYNYQFYTGPGVKYKVLQLTYHDLMIGTNVLYAKDEKSAIDYDINGDQIDYPNPDNTIVASTTPKSSRDYMAFRADLEYEWRILHNLKFQQDANYRAEASDLDNYFIYSKSALISKITDIFSLGLSYKIDYINKHDADKERMDTTLTANIIIDY